MDNERLIVGEPQGELRPSSSSVTDQRISALEARVLKVESILKISPFTGPIAFLSDLTQPAEEEE